MAIVLPLIDDNAHLFMPGFASWLIENYRVWMAFEHEAMKVYARGRRKYSARTIVEVLRHESALSDTGADYKLNGNSVPDLARLYMLAHPEHGQLFETRVPGKSKRSHQANVG